MSGINCSFANMVECDDSHVDEEDPIAKDPMSEENFIQTGGGVELVNPGDIVGLQTKGFENNMPRPGDAM
eukprot:6779479-Karenia_brevis.AAC.1